MSYPGVTFTRHWHHVSAHAQTLGPLASRIAGLLMGKHKPRGIYSQGNNRAGDYVVVTDAENVVVTGKKAIQKKYYRHSRYPGNLKTTIYKDLMEKDPTSIIRFAVSGMLPKNTLRDRRLERLKIFVGPDNPFAKNVTKRYDAAPVASQVGEKIV